MSPGYPYGLLFLRKKKLMRIAAGFFMGKFFPYKAKNISGVLKKNVRKERL